MKRTFRNNINTEYSLHDMNVIAFEVMDNDIVMRTQSGLIKTTPPLGQPDGYVEFHDVKWDFIEKYKQFGFSIMDETYGYNMTKYNGYLLANRQHCECVIEIYHEGDMIFVAED